MNASLWIKQFSPEEIWLELWWSGLYPPKGIDSGSLDDLPKVTQAIKPEWMWRWGWYNCLMTAGLPGEPVTILESLKWWNDLLMVQCPLPFHCSDPCAASGDDLTFGGGLGGRRGRQHEAAASQGLERTPHVSETRFWELLGVVPRGCRAELASEWGAPGLGVPNQPVTWLRCFRGRSRGKQLGWSSASAFYVWDWNEVLHFK